jgi:predicted anti-sigma-YlaC factor YlaD
MKPMCDKPDCKRLLKSFSVYLDDEAEEALCAEIERHLAECPNCRVVVDTLSKTVKFYHDHSHTALSKEARERLYTALDISDYLQDSEA